MIRGSSCGCGRVQVAKLGLREPHLPREQLERVGDERLGVREVRVEVPEPGRRARVDRLRDEQASGSQRREGQLEEARERDGRQVFHDLQRGHRAQLPRFGERGEQILLLGLEAGAAREGDHVGVGVHPARLDPRLAEQTEELAAAAADIEHRCVPGEQLDVRALALADLLDGRPQPGLVGEVVGEGVLARLRRDGCRSGAETTALEAQHALLELVHPAFRRLGLRRRRVDPLREGVGHAQDRVVERALRPRERLGRARREAAEATAGDRRRLDAPRRLRL